MSCHRQGSYSGEDDCTTGIRYFSNVLCFVGDLLGSVQKSTCDRGVIHIFWYVVEDEESSVRAH